MTVKEKQCPLFYLGYYTEVIDPAEENRIYTETDLPVNTGETEQKAAAYDILMGGVT